MKRYVLVYPRKCADYATNKQVGHATVMLVTKAKPSWQKGRFNFVGGHVEEGEDFIAAAQREFKEETGLPSWNYELAGRVLGEGWVIEVFTCFVDKFANPRGLPAEPVNWYNWYEVRDDERLMGNLRVMVPLCMNRETGWELEFKPADGIEDTVPYVRTGLNLKRSELCLPTSS